MPNNPRVFALADFLTTKLALKLKRCDTLHACVYARAITRATVSWKVTAQRHEATLCALASTRMPPVAAPPHLARGLEERRGPHRRALLPE